MKIDGRPAKSFSAQILYADSDIEPAKAIGMTAFDTILRLRPGGHVARPSTRVSTDRLREWARTGAEAALKQLRAEIIAIERTFAELALPSPRRAIRRSAVRAGRRARRM